MLGNVHSLIKLFFLEPAASPTPLAGADSGLAVRVPAERRASGAQRLSFAQIPGAESLSVRRSRLWYGAGYPCPLAEDGQQHSQA